MKMSSHVVHHKLAKLIPRRLRIPQATKGGKEKASKGRGRGGRERGGWSQRLYWLSLVCAFVSVLRGWLVGRKQTMRGEAVGEKEVRGAERRRNLELAHGAARETKVLGCARNQSCGFRSAHRLSLGS